ncbi:porin [Adhaeribacter aquaticus]|uniref:porin n=1 Tax=Adhaeribacter aquaticus TaxID=299567 RepID=UPI0004125932|nr:porin [Adhaeribacter aquaticus]
MKRLYLALVFACFLLGLKATAQDSAAVTISGYAEVYYGFDFAKPQNHERPYFLYNHKRHNEVNINLAFAKASYTQATLRANLALMTGNYAQYNLAAEPTLLRFIYEANIGVKLSRQHNLWLDAGIMPSHIGFESAVAADCWTVSRSIVAENSPYYETGAKVTFINKKANLQVAGLILNGWQRIQRPDNINKPSAGFQLNYKPTSQITLNYSNFIGTDSPDSLNAIRTYHNLYGIYQLGKKWGLITGFDIGRDKNSQRNYAFWYTPVLIVKHNLTSASTVALRGELYKDKTGIIIDTQTPNGFQTYGLSINYDYAITSKSLARLEGRSFFSEDNIFRQNSQRTNYSVLLSLSCRL